MPVKLKVNLMWQEFHDRLTNRDYLRWRRKRMFMRLLLTVVTLLLLSPIIAIYEIFHIRSTLGFIVLIGCVLFLLAIYRALGLIGRPYIPPKDVDFD